MKPTPEVKVERVDDDLTLNVLDKMARTELVPPARTIPSRFTGKVYTVPPREEEPDETELANTNVTPT
jgi:hypothetical protein